MSAFEELSDVDDSEGKEFQIKAKAVLLTYHIETDLCPDLQTFISTFSDFLHDSDRVSYCRERGSSNHFHVFLERMKQIDCSSKHFNLFDCNPNAQPNLCKGSGFRLAADRGHFYVYCEYKNTHLESQATWMPCEDYVVRSKWIMDLWGKNKINDDQVIPCLAHYKCLTPATEAQIRMSVARKKSDDKALHKRARMARLTSTLQTFIPNSHVDSWKLSYDTESFRYKFLTLVGPSRLGKTQYARSLFTNPFVHSDSICWHGYDEDHHSCVIFDDVKSIWKYVSDNRALFQAAGDVTVQTSATNLYAICVDVFAKPLIITTNSEPTSDWAIANSLIVHVTEPLWSPP